MPRKDGGESGNDLQEHEVRGIQEKRHTNLCNGLAGQGDAIAANTHVVDPNAFAVQPKCHRRRARRIIGLPE